MATREARRGSAVRFLLMAGAAVVLVLGGTRSGFAQANLVVPQISAGDNHSLVLRSDGTVWAWGRNFSGQVGDNTGINASAAVRVPCPLPAVDISAGGSHSLAVMSDSTVCAFGDNFYGQLGDGTTVRALAPIQIPNLSGVVAVDGGGNHSLALKSDGTVWAWGRNLWGQLGPGFKTAGINSPGSTVPVQCAGLTGVVAVTAGSHHSLALRGDGTVWAWGHGYLGQLGNGVLGESSIPIQIPNFSGIVALACGYAHSLALRNDGTLWAWGANHPSGQLGIGTTTFSSVPVQVFLPAPVASIGAGLFHSLMTLDDGTIWAWGENEEGQIAQAAATYSLAPVQIPGLAGASAVSGGGDHSLALLSDGTVWACGNNEFGQIGDGTTTARTSPVLATNIRLLADVVSLGVSQPGGAGSPVHIHNAGLTPGRQYYNIFSLDLCPGGPGTVFAAGLCISSSINTQFVLDQLLTPVGTPVTHFTATSRFMAWDALSLPPITVDAICFDHTAGLLGEISSVVRITID